MWRTFEIEFLNFGVQRHFQQYFSYRVYHGDQFKWWRKPEYPERTTDPGQAIGKLYHLRLRVECTLFKLWSYKLVAMIYPVAEILLKVALNTNIQKFNFKCPSHMCLDLNSFGRTFSVNMLIAKTYNYGLLKIMLCEMWHTNSTLKKGHIWFCGTNVNGVRIWWNHGRPGERTRNKAGFQH
jgi:hypothetical protein